MGIFLGICMVWCKVTPKDSLMDDLRWEAQVLLNNAVGDNPWIKEILLGFHGHDTLPREFWGHQVSCVADISNPSHVTKAHRMHRCSRHQLLA